MANDSKKTKADAVPKKDAAVKADSAPAKQASKPDAAKDVSKDMAKPDAPKDAAKPDAPKDAPKTEGSETAATAPANYSRGEGQKPVTAAYRQNWNAIFAKKKTKKKR